MLADEYYFVYYQYGLL